MTDSCLAKTSKIEIKIFQVNKDYLSEIYKVEAEKYSKTRDIHWRINISIWSVLIIAIYAKSKNAFNISGINILIQICVGLFFLIVHAIFIFKMHGSLNRSLARMHDIATLLLEAPDSSQIKWKDIGKKAPKPNSKWEYLQLSITIFLIAMLYFIKFPSTPVIAAFTQFETSHLS